ncbi:hypothetical protein [Janthinobacterium agaricidamnosum]|uniref:hypothetical protein n=1 Tax=Janthinobacterium agaricidamnosum TaxID=55508 RepID=UPI0013CEB51F|nr:hypothetical protein [Janthinobacterium agaricidamnosum]
MDACQKMQHRGYEYQITSYRKGDGMFQGMILLTAHAGIQYSPIIEIPTPSAFKAERAARIEASALACQLIETGAMTALMPQGGKANSWPVESETFL